LNAATTRSKLASKKKKLTRRAAQKEKIIISQVDTSEKYVMMTA